MIASMDVAVIDLDNNDTGNFLTTEIAQFQAASGELKSLGSKSYSKLATITTALDDIKVAAEVTELDELRDEFSSKGSAPTSATS